jgi:hypothetical protein
MSPSWCCWVCGKPGILRTAGWLCCLADDVEWRVDEYSDEVKQMNQRYRAAQDKTAKHAYNVEFIDFGVPGAPTCPLQKGEAWTSRLT